MLKKITIKEIAQQLGVSTATVSRALNDSYEVSDQLKVKIRNYADSAGYRPDNLAANLRRGRSKTIGVVIPSIAYNFNVKAITGIEDVLGRRGYKVMIAQSIEKQSKEKEAVQYLLSNGIDGIILSLAAETENFDHILSENMDGKPLVLMDRTTDGLQNSQVIIDHEEASYHAVRHLIENGCKKIAWVTGPAYLQIGKLRQRGYDKALSESNIPFDESLICHCSFNEDMGFSQIKELLCNQPDIDGIYAINDRFAIGAMGAIHHLGLSIPEDVAVIGFNNEPFDHLLHPPLTSVNQPSFSMGQEAARLMLGHLRDPDLAPQCRVFKTEIVLRESSRRVYV